MSESETEKTHRRKPPPLFDTKPKNIVELAKSIHPAAPHAYETIQDEREKIKLVLRTIQLLYISLGLERDPRDAMEDALHIPLPDRIPHFVTPEEIKQDKIWKKRETTKRKASVKEDSIKKEKLF